MKRFLCLITGLVMFFAAAGCSTDKEKETLPEESSAFSAETTEKDETDVSESEEESTENITEAEKETEETERVISYLGKPADEETVYFSGNPCADGGYLFEYAGKRGISFAADDEDGILRTAYIIGSDQDIIPGEIRTGGDYDMYKRHVTGLSELRYDPSCFSYCADFEHEYEDNTYYVTMYFTNNGAKCNGATISLDKLSGQYTGDNARTGPFMLEYFGRTLGEVKDFCANSGAKLGWDTGYSRGEEYIDITVDLAHDDGVYQDENANDSYIIKSIFVAGDTDAAILPGVYGSTFSACAEQLGLNKTDSESGEIVIYGTFRVGAVNIETFVYPDENDSSKIAAIKFICKPLCR